MRCRRIRSLYFLGFIGAALHLCNYFPQPRGRGDHLVQLLHGLPALLVGIFFCKALLGVFPAQHRFQAARLAGQLARNFALYLGTGGLFPDLPDYLCLLNLRGGLIVLLFKPYKVGDWIESQGVSGTVKEIQIFHTILTTGDNKVIYIPNGAMSSGVVTNYNTQTTRRVEWIVGVDYGEDYNKVQQIVRDILTADKRILTDPAPFIALHALDASSVNVVARVWVNTADYWGVYFDINKTIYETFNEKGINFPFPQLTVHQGN